MMTMSELNRKKFPDYSVDMIENTMSLRIPQTRSIKILDDILSGIELSKNPDLVTAAQKINDNYPIFTGFDHAFMSLTFALATGVGKTKLMGAFITYLYTNKSVKNFFVVAPSLTIYEKLKNDLGNPDPHNEKYVFQGIQAFATKKPRVWFDDDYKDKGTIRTTDDSEVNIYIFNISKFNTEDRGMKKINEILGESFYEYLTGLDDLVIIMDESHHYRASSSFNAISELKPVLGLELTATPKVQQGNKEVLFKNVVYEYPLSKAIRDGYTRTPYAMARQDLNVQNLSDDDLDHIMLSDGIRHHENMVEILKAFAFNNNMRLVKPFMLVVCRDTTHANQICDYIKSTAFRGGKYKDKVIVIHSNLTGEEKDENVQQLLGVERTDNPIEIVIHVNKLKEGWDVNNLYTIVPLRTATSKVLREQTIGRGLRLPYGKRTGDRDVDSVVLTAHDKFQEVINEAASQDSIFHAGGVIEAAQEVERQFQQSQPVSPLVADDPEGEEFRAKIKAKMKEDHPEINPNDLDFDDLTRMVNQGLAEIAAKHAREDQPTLTPKTLEGDLAKRAVGNDDLKAYIEASFAVGGDKITEEVNRRIMYIPRIQTEDLGQESYIVQDFDLDMSAMHYVPLTTNIILQDLSKAGGSQIIEKDVALTIKDFNPKIELATALAELPLIDYEKTKTIIQKIIVQFITEFVRRGYNDEQIRNIVIANKGDIVAIMGNQLAAHIAVKYPGLVEKVSEVSTDIIQQRIDTTGGVKDFHSEPDTNISSIAYKGAKKSLTDLFKFDSNQERIFAVVCDDYSPDVINWLRPDARQFNITYNRGKHYEPDFVVETSDCYYLVEVKARNQLTDPDVLAKKDRAISYCKKASEYNVAHGHKPFKYVFIPHDEITMTSSFKALKDRFLADDGK